MQSPTGCTKQLMSVAWMSVPAALMMRPAPMAPACRLARNRASYFSRRAGASTEARARATRLYRSSTLLSPGLRYFSRSTSRLMGCRGEMEGVREGGVSRFMARNDSRFPWRRPCAPSRRGKSNAPPPWQHAGAAKASPAAPGRHAPHRGGRARCRCCRHAMRAQNRPSAHQKRGLPHLQSRSASRAG